MSNANIKDNSFIKFNVFKTPEELIKYLEACDFVVDKSQSHKHIYYFFRPKTRSFARAHLDITTNKYHVDYDITK
jgi:hypothetical protein